jgi:BMFP domain-containing protein YqiC
VSLLASQGKTNVKIEAGQQEMEARAEACHERMEAAMRSMRSDIERSVQKQMADALSVVNRKTQSLQMDLMEKIESTHVKLETIELSLGMETNNIRLDLSTMQTETLSNRQVTFERLEAVRREFHTRLEEAKEMTGQARGRGKGMCAATPPNFDGTTSWSVFRRQFETVAAQQMDAQREIHISDYSLGRPGDRCAARDSERRDL